MSEAPCRKLQFQKTHFSSKLFYFPQLGITMKTLCVWDMCRIARSQQNFLPKCISKTAQNDLKLAQNIWTWEKGDDIFFSFSVFAWVTVVCAHLFAVSAIRLLINTWYRYLSISLSLPLSNRFILYPFQGQGGCRAYPRNTVCKAEVHSGWDANPLQGWYSHYLPHSPLFLFPLPIFAICPIMEMVLYIIDAVCRFFFVLFFCSPPTHKKIPLPTDLLLLKLTYWP